MRSGTCTSHLFPDANQDLLFREFRFLRSDPRFLQIEGLLNETLHHRELMLRPQSPEDLDLSVGHGFHDLNLMQSLQPCDRTMTSEGGSCTAGALDRVCGRVRDSPLDLAQFVHAGSRVSGVSACMTAVSGRGAVR